jgi:hypothetical protein
MRYPELPNSIPCLGGDYLARYLASTSNVPSPAGGQNFGEGQGYITVTIGLPDPAQLSAHPSYIRAACAHTGARPRENFAFLKTILDQGQTLYAVAKEENRATFGADEI